MPEQLIRTDQTAPIDQTSSDTLFMEGLRENSNLEMDWLWLANRVEDAGQQRYCFRRALAINPESRLAQRGLARLLRPPRRPLKLVWRGLVARAGRSMQRRLHRHGGFHLRS